MTVTEATTRDEAAEENAERITVLAEEFTPAALEFHRREMGKRGYRVEGPIRAHRFQMIEGFSAPSALFDGKPYFAVTFVRSAR